MLNNIHPKYIAKVTPKNPHYYNPVHLEVEGSTATIIDLEVGKRGWLAYHIGLDDWHRLHISTVESVAVDNYGNVRIETRNTNYTLVRIAE